MGSFRFFEKIMDAKSALGVVSDIINPVHLANINELTYYIVFSAGVSAGAVQLETAHDGSYTGTWSPEGSAVSWGDNVVKHVSVTGITSFRRARISTGIVNGTVTIYAMGR